MTFLSITVSDHRAFSVVTLNGELDTLSAGRLRQVIERALACGRVHLVVDTAGLRFCDSCGLRTLITAWRQTNEQGGSLRLIRVHGPLGRLLELTGLSTLFPTGGALDRQTTAPAGTAAENAVTYFTAHRGGRPPQPSSADGRSQAGAGHADLTRAQPARARIDHP
ncbi:STAS domain-containing protein [Planomonospora sp. ID91781]|uniref:STAS domain-containing protein n=1 Tax=Planomonospora sp. ID91781 TaxID=2738135 RepID=UPI0018C40EFB|nr:STAS domain-containing protein [Planomonospora sp. ID91781]MBG0823033.1 STAS domain-containing protein [Planomonospora sp. ID91781]